MKPILTTVLITFILLMVNACSNQQAQVKQYYRLDAPTDITNQAITTKPSTLVVKRPMALSILGGRPMVATQADGSLVQLSHNYWIESPKILLQDVLQTWAANHWQQVSSQVPQDDHYHILESRILAFEKNQSMAKVHLEFYLYDTNNQLIFNQQMLATESIENDGFKAFTQAITMALNTILNQLGAELADVN